MIEAAGQLFTTKGYAATSVRGIVEESGAPWGSLHHYFPGGKEQIGLAAVELGDRSVRDAIAHCLQQTASPQDAVALFFELGARKLQASGYHEGCPVATIALESASESTALAAASARTFREWRAMWAKAFRGAGLPAKRARELASILITNFEGALLLGRAWRSAEPLALAADTLATLLEHELG
jgi:TetR/AcrR family transcriptional repressor of lmrAB and yxaGH operons